jgi:transposase InsO family protein
VDERLRFIAALQEDPRGNFSRLCSRFGISRAKGYKWVERYNELGPAGLEDQPPIARSCPHRTNDAVIDALVALRKEFPFDGPKKLRERLVARGEVPNVPAASTIGDLLKKRGLVRPRKTRVRRQVPPNPSDLDPCTFPNDVWAIDFKGHFPLGDRTRCHPLTLTDTASRYLLTCQGVLRPDHAHVRKELERVFNEFGLPQKIRSDNGPPFASTALGGLSHLSVWWIRLGILPERIEPGKPQQNGRHERMHKTLQEQTASPPRANLVEQQRAFDLFRGDYNQYRPHEALGMSTPGSVYTPSTRVMPERLPPMEYGADKVVRHVDEKGKLSWRSHFVQCGSPLANQTLGLSKVDEDEWEVFFGPLHIGYLLVREGKPVLERFT